MSIRAEHINYLYGEGTAFEQYALKDVSFEIEDGQFIGLIGHTGSGKSTLIQHLNGLLRASSGTIRRDMIKRRCAATWDWCFSTRSISFLRWMYFPMSVSGRRIRDFLMK